MTFGESKINAGTTDLEAQSEESHENLAVMREQFKAKESQYKLKIAQLAQKIFAANNVAKEKAAELSFAVASNQNEYRHLQRPEREQIVKKDLQIKLLQDRIAALQDQQMSKLQSGPLAQIPDRAQVRTFITNCAKLYKTRQTYTDQLQTLKQIMTDQVPGPAD